MGSYVDYTVRNPLGSQYQRSGRYPIDRSSIFASYDDACKYALGKRSTSDERKLYGSSYVGQIITVYENGVISVYKIEENRTLTRLDDNFVKIIDVNGVEYSPTTAGTVELTVVATGISSDDKMLTNDGGLLKSVLTADTVTESNKRYLRLLGKNDTVIAKCDITNSSSIGEYVIKTEYNPIAEDVTIKHVNNNTIDFTKISFGTAFTATTSLTQTTEGESVVNVKYSIKSDIYADYDKVENLAQEIASLQSQLNQKINKDYYVAGSGLTFTTTDDHCTIDVTGITCGNY